MRQRVLEIVRGAVDDLNEELGYDELRNPNENTGLHGGEQGIDSLSLVSLIVDLEGQISSEFSADVVLADEKAMSSRNSPYRTVGALVDFIVERLNGAGSNGEGGHA
jgi:acyl carrier protein